MTTIPNLPVGLKYINPEVGYTSFISACDAGHPEYFFVALLFTPGVLIDHQLKLNNTDLCVILKRVYKTGTAVEVQRFYAKDSAEWLTTHGGDPLYDNQGKYGPGDLTRSGNDLVLIFNMRINGCQTPIMWLMPNAAI